MEEFEESWFRFKEGKAEVKGETMIHGWVTRVEDLNSLDIEGGFGLFIVKGHIVQTVAFWRLEERRSHFEEGKGDRKKLLE